MTLDELLEENKDILARMKEENDESAKKFLENLKKSVDKPKEP